MHRFPFLILPAVLAMFLAPGLSADAPDPRLKALEEALNQATDTVGMGDASANLTRYWDEMLAKEVKATRKWIRENHGGGEKLKIFNAAQARWRKHRKSDLRLESAVAEGSVGRMSCNLAYGNITRQRIERLQALRKGLEMEEP